MGLLIKKTKQPLKIFETYWKELYSKRSKEDISKINSVDLDYSDAKNKFELAKFDMRKKFEELELFKNIDFLGSLCSLLNSQLKLHKKSYDLLNEIYPTLSTLQGRLAILEGQRGAFKLQKVRFNSLEDSKPEKLTKLITLSSYQARNENELSFKEDQIIELISKRVNMSVGQLDSKIGLFPNNLTLPYVENDDSNDNLDSLDNIDTDQNISQQNISSLKITDGNIDSNDLGNENSLQNNNNNNNNNESNSQKENSDK
ncbi:sh3 domain-containing [Anaeramoeba ignava]|uniref:Sh3 domain-containing n=1 Tax=Anaeramoeba ignava TaxID=1746090 RepID=A0A9Q0LC67_ANAIG|nr:sh3 domain-containing [Anaeramoeba ignava]